MRIELGRSIPTYTSLWKAMEGSCLPFSQLKHAD